MALNNLRQKDSRPFHLKMSLQLFDLTGKAAESGTLEYWWAGPRGSLVRMHSPTMGDRDSAGPDLAAGPVSARFAVLVGQLMDAVLSPGDVLGLPHNEASTQTRTVHNMSLQCMRDVPLPTKFHPDPTDVCYDSASEVIRLVENANHVIVRNRVAHLGPKRIAIDTTILWNGLQAISGHIEQMESFDPAQSPVKLQAAESKDAARPPAPALIPGNVLAGRKIGGGAPEYPVEAREQRIRGTVILSAVITKEGRIANLVPLASPDPSLTKASVQAVSKWTYQPYLLNGEPTEVSTSITVNFNLNP